MKATPHRLLSFVQYPPRESGDGVKQLGLATETAQYRRSPKVTQCSRLSLAGKELLRRYTQSKRALGLLEASTR